MKTTIPVCKHCGQEIQKQTNFDKLKACKRIEDADKLISKLCKKKCPFIKLCSDNGCPFNDFMDWLFEEARG